jgi:hypothetical protein
MNPSDAASDANRLDQALNTTTEEELRAKFDDDLRARELAEKRQKLTERREKVQRVYYFIIFGTVTSLTIMPVLAYVTFKKSLAPNTAVAFLVPLTYPFMFLAMLPMYRRRLRNIDEELQDLDFEIDLQRYKSTTRESKAEKMVRINSAQLRRYYDLNLQQNKWMFLLGIACIALGVALIGVTLFLVVSKLPNTNDKIIAAVLGAVGAFLTNFIAAMYLKMNSTAAENLAGFHTQLVKTQELLISNLLAAGIDNDDKRWAALSELSLNIVGKSAKT